MEVIFVWRVAIMNMLLLEGSVWAWKGGSPVSELPLPFPIYGLNAGGRKRSSFLPPGFNSDIEERRERERE